MDTKAYAEKLKAKAADAEDGRVWMTQEENDEFVEYQLQIVNEANALLAEYCLALMERLKKYEN